MKFDNQGDNIKLIDRLEHAVEKNCISHAYIFEGDNRIDKKSFAESFAKGILCRKKQGNNCGLCSICRKIDHGNHEDLIYVDVLDGSTSIKDEQIVSMQDRLGTKSFGERNIVIINRSDAMTARAQNRLLKTLEEPPGNAVIMLLSENIENLIQTIQSRCVKYRLYHFDTAADDTINSIAVEIAEMALKKEPFYAMNAVVEKLLKNKENINTFLDSLQIYYRNMLVEKNSMISRYSDDEIIAAIHEIETARKKLKQNVSAVYSIKKLILEIGG